MTEHRGQHREGKQRHAENQYGGYAVMQEPSPFALSDEPESALRRRPHRRWCQSRTLVTAISCSSFSTNNIGRQFRLPSTRIAFRCRCVVGVPSYLRSDAKFRESGIQKRSKPLNPGSRSLRNRQARLADLIATELNLGSIIRSVYTWRSASRYEARV